MRSLINYNPRIVLNSLLPPTANILSDSPYCLMMRGEGRCLVNTVHLTVGNGANNAVNVFSFVNPFRLVRIYGILTDVTNIADFEDVGFELWDGAVLTPLTLRNPGGPVLDGYSNYSMIAKVGVAGVAIAALNANQVRLDETLTTRTFTANLICARSGMTNYIRIAYDSLAIDVTITTVLIYEDVSYSIPSGLTVV